MQYAVEKRNVAARFDRQEQIAGSGNGSDAWVNNDYLRAVFSRLPNIVCRDRGAFSDVSAAYPHNLGLKNVRPGIGRAINSEGLLVGGAGTDHAKASVVVNIGRLQTHAGELAHEIGFLSCHAGAAEQCERVGTMCTLNSLDLGRYTRD